MRLYYMTDVAHLILLEGFGDGTSYGFAAPLLAGGIVTDRPIGITEGAIGEQVLQLDLPDQLDLEPYELTAPPPAPDYREWCIPAPVLNQYAQARLLNDDEATHAWMRTWRYTCDEHSTQ